MDKSEMLSVMERIEKKLSGQKSVSYMEYNSKAAWRVLQELWDDSQRQFMFNGVHYNFTYNPSHTTHGNRSTTPDFTVTKYGKKEMFNADLVLAKKEITVRHFHGGGMEGYLHPIEIKDDGSILDVVGALYESTSYNIMIQRHGTGDVTIWVDDKNFRQR
jgi:hypothetical protein